MGQQIRGTFFYQTAFHQLSQSGLQESRNPVLPTKKKSALKALRKTYTLKHCIVDPEDRAQNLLLSGRAESSTDRPHEVHLLYSLTSPMLEYGYFLILRDIR